MLGFASLGFVTVLMAILVRVASSGDPKERANAAAAMLSARVR
jgi:hypothetical protein